MLSDTQLLHYSRRAWKGWRPVHQDPIFQPNKPEGLWLSVGGAWKIHCVEHEREGFAPQRLTFIYEVKLQDGAKVPKLDTYEAVEAFSRHYWDIHYGVNWRDVEKDYSGISVLNYEPRGDENIIPWYEALDIPSACIWEESAIASIERVNTSKRKAG